MLFLCSNVKFKEGFSKDEIIATGEIENRSQRDYSVAMFKFFLFDRKQIIGTGIVKIYEFKRGARKHFETAVQMNDCRPISAIARYETLFDSGY